MIFDVKIELFMYLAIFFIIYKSIYKEPEIK